MESPYFRRQIQASVPKLPNHLRTYYNVWARNKRARDASERAKKGVDALKALNETTKALVAACLGELADAPVAATANQQLRPAPEQARAPSMIPQVVGGVVVGPQGAVLAQAAGSDERKGKGRSEEKKKRGSATASCVAGHPKGPLRLATAARRAPTCYKRMALIRRASGCIRTARRRSDRCCLSAML